ncbi:DNA primase small subunit [Cytospora mali]|uniref:DNA primase n=1 Tax=Cytospora mali TaxID=578113 RepID=A0A194W7M8_CYTMA|nr:DNA primase small subunit [Valsa mali]
MPHSESPASSPPVPTPTSEQFEQMEQDTPVKNESHEDETTGDISMADVKANLPSEESKNEAKLDELFADDDSDEEFPSTGKTTQSQPIPTSSPGPDSSAYQSGDAPIRASASDPEVMRSFYQRLFPWRYLFQWLNHSPTPTNDFGHREFAFTLQNDAYLRYQSFPTADLIRKDVLRLLPSRFEIGPVYSTNPRDRKQLKNLSAFRPLSKELCFDIDLTDYDDIRTCCDKANICIKCWQFITMAIRVVDVALREDFGFKHIMWVYSGRRGAHAWVCDKKARNMDDQKRRAVAGYLEVLKGGAQSGKKVNVRRPLHPHLTRSLEILKTHFSEDVLERQDPWDTDERAEKLLQLLPDKMLNDALRRKWASAPGRSSTSKWADIDAITKAGGASKNLDTKDLLAAKQDIVLEYTYPRLDIEVSKKLNHLLKSPFVVHPGTGRVCVPIDTRPGKLEEFDPTDVPTVQNLLGEIDTWTEGAGDEEKKSIQDWEKTSLKPYIEQFRSFVNALMKDERGNVRVKREREETESMEF